MKLPTIHQVPLIRYLFPMIVGILIFTQFQNEWLLVALSTISIFLIFSFYIIKRESRHRFRPLFGWGMSFAMVAIGWWLTQKQSELSTFDFPKKATFYYGEVISNPEVKERSIACRLSIQERKQEKDTRAKKIVAYFQKSNSSLRLRQGDFVVINAVPQRLVNTNRPGSFDYAIYLKRQGVSASAYIDSVHWGKLSKEREFHLTTFATLLQSKILTIFRSFQFKDNEYALLSGITIGYKDDLTLEQKNNFSAVGLSHLMAVSGMQTAMVFSMFWFLLGFIPKSSKSYWLKFIVVIIGLWVFTYITGLSASVVRASIMLTVLMIGGLFNRPTETLNSLFFSAFCILLFNPYALFDIGFQLSYMAVIAIIFTQRLMDNRLDRMQKIPRYFAEIIVMTIAAQIGTSPLSIFYFHQFPLFFLIVNLIVLPFNAFLVYLATATTALSALHLPLFGCDKLLQLMLSSLDSITGYFSQFSFSQIKDLYPNSYQILIIYLFIGSIIWFLAAKKFRILNYALILLIAFWCVDIYKERNIASENNILVYNELGQNIIEHCYYGQTMKSKPSEAVFILGGKKVIRLTQDIKHSSITEKIECDFLILSKGFKGDLKKINELFTYKKLIIDSSVSRYYSEIIEQEVNEKQVDHFNIEENGAFAVSLN